MALMEAGPLYFTALVRIAVAFITLANFISFNNAEFILTDHEASQLPILTLWFVVNSGFDYVCIGTLDPQVIQEGTVYHGYMR